MYKGWIEGDIQDAQFLKNLGIKLGYYRLGDAYWLDCEVSEAAMSNLDHHWGRFTWSLTKE